MPVGCGSGTVCKPAHRPLRRRFGQIHRAYIGSLPRFLFFQFIARINESSPFLPLDGGRLALALIEKRIGRARAQRTLSLFGIIFGVLLFCAGVLLVSAADAVFNPTPLAAGFFIFISALSEFRCSCGSNIKASLAGLSRLRSGSAVRVVPIALRSDCTVRKALSFIGGRGYGIIFVVEAGATVGILDENIVLNAALCGESDAELRALLPKHSASSAPNLPVFKR